jgi:ATP-dependent helicase STH1/SNF2
VKLMKSIQTYHKDKEKREAQLAEKKRRDRLRMLRNNDVEGYTAAVAEAKDERLNLLMKQTGDFLAQMGILVAKEKDSVGTGEKKDDESQPAIGSGSSKTYYTAAHTIQEEIKEQPSILVGGQLKEYQVNYPVGGWRRGEKVFMKI